MSWFQDLPLRWKLLGCVGLILALTSTLSVLAYRGVVAHDASATLVNETLTVLRLTNEAESSLEQMQTGYRGFLLTGGEEFFDTYDAGKATFWARLALLRARAAQDPEQARRWLEIERAALAWQQEIAEPGIRSRRGAYVTGGALDQLTALVPAGVGRQQIETIQRHLSDAQRAESARLEQREHLSRAANARLKLILIWGTVGTVGLGLLCAWLLARDVIAVASQLATAAASVADGDFRHRIGLRRRDELGLTAAAFDRMASQLAATDGERRQAEAGLRAANAELEQFAYTVSHDLKAPLVTIQGFAHRLIKDYGPTLHETARRYLARIEANAIQLGDLIEDVLAFSRVGRVGAPPAEVDLDLTVRGLLERLHGTVEQSGARVRVEGQLPTVVANPALVDQILTNLLTNALSYGAGPDGIPQVEIGCHDLGQRWRLFVRDHGPGISAEEQGRLFSLFERLPAGRAANPHGSGVGLATVRKAARAMGGVAGVDSSPYAGATFWVEFPKVPTAPPVPHEAPGTPARSQERTVGAIELGPSAGDESPSMALASAGAARGVPTRDRPDRDRSPGVE